MKMGHLKYCWSCYVLQILFLLTHSVQSKSIFLFGDDASHHLILGAVEIGHSSWLCFWPSIQSLINGLNVSNAEIVVGERNYLLQSIDEPPFDV